MNWNAIGAIGQILGALAVFVTIAYLAVQVRDTEREMGRAIVQSRTEGFNQSNLLLAANERLVDIHVKGDAALSGDQPPPQWFVEYTKKTGLTSTEAYMLSAELSARWNTYSQAILYVDELPPAARAELDRGLRFFLSEPVAHLWYDSAKARANPDAVRYIDKLLASPSKREGTR
jgi:hypothetical protein